MNEEELLYNKVKEWAMTQLYVSTAMIKKEFSIRFSQSMSIFDRLIEEGIISKSRTDEFGNRVLIHEIKDLEK